MSAPDFFNPRVALGLLRAAGFISTPFTSRRFSDSVDKRGKQ